MKKMTFVVAVLLAGSAFARDVYVQPHVTKNGTYVDGYHRTAPDSSQFNNYSTQGNTNPYTGQAGTVNPYTQQQQIQPVQHCYHDAYGNRHCN